MFETSMRTSFVASLAGLLLATGCATTGTTTGTTTEGGSAAAPMATPTPQFLTAEQFLKRPAGKYVVIDLEENELRFMDGAAVMWSAPVGTGTGLRLESEAGNWEFSSPTGLFFVQFKELDPVWILPDWYYVRRNLPIPPESSPQRRRPGELGVAAIYLGDEIAIHGTDKPELLGQRVSHGCIRMSNEMIRRLFHNVQVGTPVIITGQVDELDEDDIAPTIPGRPRQAQANPLTRVRTPELLSRLERQLASDDTSAVWTATAAVLIERGLRDDAVALRGVLALAGTMPDRRRDREYNTFLADAFARGTLRAVVSLARIDDGARARAANAIVTATMDLYAGPLSHPAAPWPSRRVLHTRLGPDGKQGWEALHQAEEAYRGIASNHRLAGQ
jgi:L,D-transpeptidase ErfK/SrfK